MWSKLYDQWRESGYVGCAGTHIKYAGSTEATTPPAESGETGDVTADDKAEAQDAPAAEEPEPNAEGDGTAEEPPATDAEPEKTEENPAATDDSTPTNNDAGNGNNGKDHRIIRHIRGLMTI